MANWGKLGSRGNVEDRRGMRVGAIGGMGITGVALLFLINTLTGGTSEDFLNQLESIPVQSQNIDNGQFDGSDSYEVFASTVLGSGNDMWEQLFSQNAGSYTPPRLVLFRQATDSACGYASSEIGPHYCPTDKTIYLDETFFEEMKTRFGAAGGDVAEAYVIAHELGHHAQNELGLFDKLSRNNSNENSIKFELQADCFAGLWAHSIKDKGVFEQNEIHEAMDAAAAVGDDRIQESLTGRVTPESFTHGSSEERVRWFDNGYESGNLASCNTF